MVSELSMKITTIRYYGHSAVALLGNALQIGIDPWLQGNPLCPEDALQQQFSHIILSHGHGDHASDCIRLANGKETKVLATFELAEILVAEGLSPHQVIAMNKGGKVTLDGITFALTHALHSSSYQTTAGHQYAGEACGVIVSDEKNTFYHTGDTSFFSDISLIAKKYKPTIGFFCCGDHFTMGAEEAAEAAAISKVKVAFPIHHSTFPLLTGSPTQFIELTGGTGKLLNPGDTFDITKSEIVYG